MPLMLLGAVSYPLYKAVNEMSSRSSVRQRIAELMSRSQTDRIVQYSLDQAARPVVLRVVVVGDPASARKLEHRLRDELAALGEATAAVSVWAVSDATAVSALSARLDDVPAVLPEPPPAPKPVVPVEVRVRNSWPATAGDLVAVWTRESPQKLRVVHLGPPLGTSGAELLARAVADGPVPTIDELELELLELDEGGFARWLARALAMLAHAPAAPEVWFCVDLPAQVKGRRPTPDDVLARALIDQLARQFTNVRLAVADTWRVTPSRAACASPPP